LGLAIVKAIALMHGGEVFVRSEAGANTFGIRLPNAQLQGFAAKI
jgi:two-component system heavy metal sensor histidine kinase CusS